MTPPMLSFSRKGAIIRRFAFVAGLLPVVAAGKATALDPTRSFDQLSHKFWTVENGAPTNIAALAQTPDGYLWIGAANGLYRFDGIRFERPPEFQASQARSDSILSLKVATNGDLWIGHVWGGVSVLHNGQLEDANAVPSGGVARIVQTNDGAIWVALLGRRTVAQLRRFLNGRWEIIDRGERGLPNVDLVDALAARDGSLWVALIDRVVRLKPGAQRFEAVSDKVDQAESLAQDADGRIWINDASGPHPLVGMPAQKDLGPYKAQSYGLTADFITDRQGELWVASDHRGLLRIPNPAALAHHRAGSEPERFDVNGFGSAGAPAALLEDREGNIWVGASGGLIRFRGISVTPYLHNVSASILDGDIELVPGRGGDFYTLWGNGTHLSEQDRTRLYYNHFGTFSDLSNRVFQVVDACTAPDNTLWISDGTSLLSMKDGRVLKSIPLPDSIKRENMSFCEQDNRGRVWVLMTRSGLFVFDSQTWSHYDLPGDSVTPPWVMTIDPAGRILTYLQRGSLFRIDGNDVTKLIDKTQIEFHKVSFIYCVGNQVFLGGDRGLMVGEGGRFKTLSASRFPFLSHVAGMVRTQSGDIWLLSAAGLVRLTNKDFNQLLSQENVEIEPRIFDFQDGLEDEANENLPNEVVEGGDGRIWIATTGALSWIDPQNLPHNDVPPPVLIRTVSSNQQVYGAASRFSLPAGTTQLQIDYTATSLSIPERVRFRYRLTGVDSDWIDAGTRRQAFYTNLGPGNYRFTVLAANDDGVWNMRGASTEFRIPPTFVQSQFFIALCVMASTIALWLLYRWRLDQVAARLRLGHEARLAERERIARELHDTLLQGFQSLVFRFQAVADSIPKGQLPRELLEKALDRADLVVAEARDRVVQLRQTETGGLITKTLQASVNRILADSRIEVRSTTEGTPRDLTSVVKEELVSISEEFLFNTLQHAAATQINIALNFDRKALSLKLSDNGRGIDRQILQRGGREGHFGLAGMRERACKIGAEFELSSQPGAGVVVSLKVPAAVAYSRTSRWIVPLPLTLLNTIAD